MVATPYLDRIGLRPAVSRLPSSQGSTALSRNPLRGFGPSWPRLLPYFAGRGQVGASATLLGFEELQSAGSAIARSVDLAQHVEQWGYKRCWLAEHHSISGLACSATPVLIGHVAA